MAKKRIVRGKNVQLKKLMAGLMVVCFLVFVFGQIAQGVSARSLLFWSSFLMLVIGGVLRVILRLWLVWADISDGPQDKSSK